MPRLYEQAPSRDRAGDRRRGQHLRAPAPRDPRRASTTLGARIARTDDEGSSPSGATAPTLLVWRERGERASQALGRLGAWRRPRDAPLRAGRAPPSRRSPGARRSPLRSCSSPVPRRSAPSGRSPASAIICAPRIRASRSPTFAPTTTTSGTLLAVTSPSLFGEPRLVRVTGVEKCSDAFLAEAVSYLAFPQDGATVVLRHTGATVRGKKLLDAVRAGEGGGIEIACPAVKRDSDRFDFAAGEFSAARKRDRARGAAHPRLGVRRRPHRARRRLPAAHLRRARGTSPSRSSSATTAGASRPRLSPSPTPRSPAATARR